MKLQRLISLELKSFVHGRTALMSLVFLIAAGIYGIFLGQSVISKQNAVIAQIPEFIEHHREKELALNPEDLGNLLYSLQFPTAHEPSRWAPFSIGQRDVNPFNLNVRMLTLEGQLYNSDLTNPVGLLYGNFDPAFVILFLFPLAIIAFAHDVASADRESGIRSLLKSQPFGVGKLILVRLAIRFGVVFTAAFVLITTTGAVVGGLADARYAYALVAATGYLLFWFALAAFVVSFDRSTAFNALTLLGSWIVLTILAPALINLAISTALPVSESFEVTIAQREGYHRKWDVSKAVTMRPFFEKYPQFSGVPIPEDKFSWGWYYAMQNAGDEESLTARNGYGAKLNQRDWWTKTLAAAVPTIGTQIAFNSISGGDLAAHLAYLESIRDLHTRVREHFYPFIFRNAKTGEVDWSKVPVHKFSDDLRPAVFPLSVIPVYGLAVLLMLAAIASIRRRLG